MRDIQPFDVIDFQEYLAPKYQNIFKLIISILPTSQKIILDFITLIKGDILLISFMPLVELKKFLLDYLQEQNLSHDQIEKFSQQDQRKFMDNLLENFHKLKELSYQIAKRELGRIFNLYQNLISGLTLDGYKIFNDIKYKKPEVYFTDFQQKLTQVSYFSQSDQYRKAVRKTLDKTLEYIGQTEDDDLTELPDNLYFKQRHVKRSTSAQIDRRRQFLKKNPFQVKQRLQTQEEVAEKENMESFRKDEKQIHLHKNQHVKKHDSITLIPVTKNNYVQLNKYNMIRNQKTIINLISQENSLKEDTQVKAHNQLQKLQKDIDVIPRPTNFTNTASAFYSQIQQRKIDEKNQYMASINQITVQSISKDNNDTGRVHRNSRKIINATNFQNQTGQNSTTRRPTIDKLV